MVTMAKRIEELRTEKGLSRPALAAALGLPRMSVEKFETGRQTPTQEQQKKMAAYFAVPLAYLRAETSDKTTMGDWMDGAFLDEPTPAPVQRKAVRPQVVESAGDGNGSGALADAFLKSPKFRENLREVVLEVLQSPEGQKLLQKALHS